MLDSYKRDINYLRISVTDRCNLRCIYCMPPEGIPSISHSDIISFEDIITTVKQAVKRGVNKIKLTGGEPLVRKGIVDLVKMIAEIPGIEDFGLTTNGTLLANFASDLKKAGLHRINISLDTLDAEKYKQITRGGDLSKVLEGIIEAQKVGFDTIKINCVILESSTEPDAVAVADFAQKNKLQVRFIHKMNLETGYFKQVEGGDGGNCKKCNRLRITSNGNIQPCLFSESSFSIYTNGIDQAFNLALANKPKMGSLNKKGQFYNIGG